MGCSAVGKVLSRFVQAQLTIDGQAHFAGIAVFLAIIFPPTNRAEAQCPWGA
jgi:hypothetical protein